MSAPPAAPGSAPHLHLASGPLVADLDAPSVAAMLAIVRGNVAETSAFPGARGLWTRAPLPPPRTAFDANFKFGPPAGAAATFVMTAAAPSAVARPRPPARQPWEPACAAPAAADLRRGPAQLGRALAGRAPRRRFARVSSPRPPGQARQPLRDPLLNSALRSRSRDCTDGAHMQAARRGPRVRPRARRQVTVEAEPSAWQAGAPAGAPAGALPFAQARLQGFTMDLVTLEGDAGTHLAVSAAEAGLADLRLAFCQTMARCEVRGGGPGHGQRPRLKRLPGPQAVAASCPAPVRRTPGGVRHLMQRVGAAEAPSSGLHPAHACAGSHGTRAAAAGCDGMTCDAQRPGAATGRQAAVQMRMRARLPASAARPRLTACPPAGG